MLEIIIEKMSSLPEGTSLILVNTLENTSQRDMSLTEEVSPHVLDGIGHRALYLLLM